MNKPEKKKVATIDKLCIKPRQTDNDWCDGDGEREREKHSKWGQSTILLLLWLLLS